MMRTFQRYSLLAGLSATACFGQTINLSGLSVRTVATGLSRPTSMAFLAPNDYLVLEKDTGKVIRFQRGRRTEVLDLAVNNASERGALGIALHPRWPADRGVYIFWTCRTASPGTATQPAGESCSATPQTGADTNEILAVPVMGNRVDRFVWENDTLRFDRNIISLRSFQADGVPDPPGQNDETQPPRGNHDGGVIRFGPDGKLYIYFGDQGRRGAMQNLATGPNPPSATDRRDDQFGGPEPDDRHLSGVILRLNADGSAPADNPFYAYGAQVGGQAGGNLQKLYAYGMRNGFGMTFDPFSGRLWISEHGDDAFDEINIVSEGMNGGWVQVQGPISRVAEFKQIETTFGNPPTIQQFRYPPSRIADSPAEARARLLTLPGSTYIDPQFSWKWATLPNALTFIPRQMGREFGGDLLVSLVGSPAAAVGYLLRFELTSNRRALQFRQSNLEDRVADNNAKYDLTETQPLIVGSGFGVVTDMQTSNRGSIYVVSHSKGEIYEIRRGGNDDQDDDEDENDAGDANDNGGRRIEANLTGSSAVPRGDSNAAGSFSMTLDDREGRVCFDFRLSNVDLPATAAIVRGAADEIGSTVLDLGRISSNSSSACVPAEADIVHVLRRGSRDYYVVVRNSEHPFGAVRGELR